MRRLLLIPLLTVACSSPTTQASWLQGFSVDWEFTNHRLAFLALHPTEEAATAAFIGGASTTGFVFDDDGCVAADTCWEIPVTDRSLVELTVQRVMSDEVMLVTGRADLVVGADGGETTLTIPLPREGDGLALAWIGGFTVDATVALPDDAASCYDPRHGWLPTRLALGVGEPRLVDGDEALEVPVTGVFAAGPSHESQRACLDAVVDAARAAITVDVVAAVGPMRATLHEGEHGAVWPDRGTAQSPDVLTHAAVDFDHPEGLVGWRQLDFRFHEVVEPGRGAYLRTLQVEADPAAGLAFGFARNEAPALLHLSGFDYRFRGSWLEIDADLRSNTTTVYAHDGLPAELADGQPVIHTLSPAP